MRVFFWNKKRAFLWNLRLLFFHRIIPILSSNENDS